MFEPMCNEFEFVKSSGKSWRQFRKYRVGCFGQARVVLMAGHEGMCIAKATKEIVTW